jgi:23S rRNA (uracil1939-C5)-methyltransferase
MSFTVGQQVTLTIHDIAFGGEGVARVEDFVVFVPFVLVGETVEAELTEVKKNFARGKLLRVVTAAPERVQPACRFFAACGGCQYQHIAYAEQLRIKHKQIADLFQRVGGFAQAVVAPVVPCPQPYGFRNRIMIRSQWNKPEQKLNIGFVRWDCGLVEDLDECKIAEPALSAQIQHVRATPRRKAGSKWCCGLRPRIGRCRATRFSRIIFSCCRNWWTRSENLSAPAAPGIWRICIAAWDFSAFRSRTA